MTLDLRRGHAPMSHWRDGGRVRRWGHRLCRLQCYSIKSRMPDLSAMLPLLLLLLLSSFALNKRSTFLLQDTGSVTAGYFMRYFMRL
jgi:hypothetical protein